MCYPSASHVHVRQRSHHHTRPRPDQGCSIQKASLTMEIIIKEWTLLRHFISHFPLLERISISVGRSQCGWFFFQDIELQLVAVLHCWVSVTFKGETLIYKKAQNHSFFNNVNTSVFFIWMHSNLWHLFCLDHKRVNDGNPPRTFEKAWKWWMEWLTFSSNGKKRIVGELKGGQRKALIKTFHM